MKKAPICYDNGGETFDRYTLITSGRLMSNMHFGTYYEYISSSETGAGYWQHGELRTRDIIDDNGKVSFAHLGEEVPFESLHPDIQARYRDEYLLHHKPRMVFDIKEMPAAHGSGGGYAFLSDKRKSGSVQKYRVTWIGDHGPVEGRHCGTDTFVGRVFVRGKRRRWHDLPPSARMAFIHVQNKSL